MSTAKEDPFIHVRTGAPKSPPVDHLSIAELDELRDIIRDRYLMWAKDTSASEKSSTSIISTRHKEWVSVIESALAQSPHFQRLALNEELTHGSHDFKRLKLEEDWLLGLYLPGFYDAFTNFGDGYEYISGDLFKKAASNARSALVQIVRKHGASVLTAIPFDALKGRAPLPPSPTNDYIATLFTLAQEEKTQNNLRSRVYRDLQDLKTFLPSLEGGEDLFNMYERMSQHTSSEHLTLIDEYAKAVLEILPQLGSVPALDEIDMSSLTGDLDKARELAEVAGADADEYEEGATGESLDGQEDLTVLGEDEDTVQYDPASEEQVLKEEAEIRYEDVPTWFYPDWTAPTSGPVSFAPPLPGSIIEPSQETEPSQASEVDAEARPRTVLSKFKKSKGFVSARMLSYREELEAERNVTTKQDVLTGAINYVKKAIAPKADAFNKSGYQECLKWLSKVNKRSDMAATANSKDACFTLFSGFQMEDDWAHVRLLLEALRIDLKKEKPKAPSSVFDLLDQEETYLVCVFAMIRSGADDPLPWILALDGLLRNIHYAVCGKPGGATIYQTKMLSELVTWANGTAINAFVVRVPRQNHQNEGLLGAWYKPLWDYNPSCANEDCLRTLTHPDRITGKKFRALVSVGTREARVGNRGLRAFISKNRETVYPCLYDILRCCKPIKELIILFFWYSHLYHNNTCKVTRGKFSITAFV